MNTHTLYAHYVRIIETAEEIIERLQPYLTKGLKDKKGNDRHLQSYIDKLETYLKTAKGEGRAKIQKNISNAKVKITKYTDEIARAKRQRAEANQALDQLKASNTEFTSVKTQESLYTIDADTGAAWCKRNKQKTCVFKGKTVSYSEANQVDAVRIMNNNTSLTHLNIIDNRRHIEAHRDGIQLIPPPEVKVTKKEGKVYRKRMLDQMAGATLSNTLIKDCTITAKNATIQGIFGSDGMIQNIQIVDNTIETAGKHFISLAGLLNKNGQSVISGNTLIACKNPKPNAKDYVPSIHLYPTRLGGNLADDGMIYILSFSSKDSRGYGNVPKGTNTVKFLDGKTEALTILDERKLVPKDHWGLAFGLENFYYQGFYNEFTEKTMGYFIKNRPNDYRDLCNWLKIRIDEYSHPNQWDKKRPLLGKPSPEQQTIILKILRESLNALDNKTNYDKRIPDLQETPIKTFVLKKIAMHYGTVAKLDYLEGDQLKRRNELLKYFLTPTQLANQKPKPPTKDKPKKESNKQKPENGKIPKAGDAYSSDADKELAKAVRIAPDLSISQGKPIAFYFDFNDNSKYRQGYTFKWSVLENNTVTPKEGAETYYSISSQTISPGDNRVNCTVSKAGEKTERVIIRFNVTEATKPEAVIPEGTWSSTRPLKKDLRITPSQSLAKGEKIKFFFREGSKYNDDSYTFRWSISGHSNLGTGKGKSHTIDTGKLDKGEYRLVFTVTDKNGTAYNGSVNFTVLAAQATTGAQDTTSTANKDTVPTPTTKSWGALANKIMVTPSPVQQGDKATFTIDTRSFKPETSTLTYYWSFNGKTGRGASFEVDTTDLAAGEHKLNVTLYTKAQGETKRTSIPGGALFTVVEKATTTAPSASTGSTTEKPAKIGGDLGQYIRVTEKTIEKGKTITFSLDPAFIEQEEQNAKLTYYWLLPGHKAGRKSSYSIDTTALDKGSHRVQVAMYKTPNGGTRVAYNGWGMFEVVASSTTNTKGIINIQIMNQATNSPESSIRYALISNRDPSWIHQDKTDSKGKINLEDIPVGQYTLRLDEPELDIVTVESNQEN